MKNKFKIKDNRTFGQKAKSFGQSLLFWKGRSKGMIHTRNIVWSDLKYIFFPSKLEKYGYLNIIFWNDTNKYYKALYPLVLAMDYEAKPKWCPRWFLRFLHVFGNDKSLVRVRNRKLHNLHTKLTKGILVWDWKTKWTDYDLRISISGPDHLQELASAIEDRFYSTGRQKELVKQIKAIDPNASIIWGNIGRLEKKLEELENESSIRI